MAIVKMSKFTLFTFESQKEELLSKLQNFEKVQFIDLREKREDDLSFFNPSDEKKDLSEVQGDLAKVKFALDSLHPYAEKENALKSLKEGKEEFTYNELRERAEKSNWKDIYLSIKSMDDSLNSIKNEVSKLKGQGEELLPWENLDVSFGDLGATANIISFVGTMPKAFIDGFREKFDSEIPCSYVEKVSEVKGEGYLIIIVHKDYEKEANEILKTFSFNKSSISETGVPREIINDIGEKIKNLYLKEGELKSKLKEASSNIEELEVAYEYLSNEELKVSASENFLESPNVVAISGWVPTEDRDEFIKSIEKVVGNDYYIELEEAEYGDAEVPVALKNNKVVSAFQSITEMFSTPRYNEMDPTPIMTPFYLLFFGMMLADAGYGIVMFIASFIALKKFNLDEKKANFARFFMYLGIPTTVVGIIYGSYFGDILKPYGVKGFVDPANDVMTVLIASLAIGVFQIFVGLGAKAYMLIKQKQYLYAFFDVGSWYMTLGGALLFAGSLIGLPGGIVSFGKWTMIAGMVLIVLTQGRDNKSIGAKLAAGLYALYGLSGYVGDIVSYSRLMALGLAGGFIGSAFNLMIGMIGNPIAKIIFGALIFLGGHLFNVLISALGAYVHTCRLQYVEFFGKFYEGGGKPFSPLKSRNKFITVKRD